MLLKASVSCKQGLRQQSTNKIHISRIRTELEYTNSLNGIRDTELEIFRYLEVFY